MKSIKFFCLSALMLASLAAAAAPVKTVPRSGDKAGNGGDPNEIKFKSVALNIAQWIESGNASGLNLPSGISAEDYRREMLAALGNYDIEFTNEILRVGGGEKTCVNIREGGGRGKITCNSPSFGRFFEANIDDIYRIVHHEFAGLARFEESQGQDSDYRISSQISGFLRTELVKRLPVRMRGENDPFWLPATGWRQSRVAEKGPQPPVPFLLDYRNQDSVDDTRAQGGYRTVSRLFEREASFSAEDPQGFRVEARSDGPLTVSRKDGGFRFEASVARMPQLSPVPEMSYDCTLVETGERVRVGRGSGSVEIPSQRSIGLGEGKIVITATPGAIFVSRYSGGHEGILKFTRGAFTVALRFSGPGLPERGFVCEPVMGK